MKLKLFIASLIFVFQISLSFANTLQDALSRTLNVFSGLNLAQLYQVSPRFIDFLFILIILLRVAKLEKVQSAVGNKTAIIFAILASVSVFFVPQQVGLSALAIGVWGLLLISGFFTGVLAYMLKTWFWEKGFSAKVFTISASVLVFTVIMYGFGGGNLNGLTQAVPNIAAAIEFANALALGFTLIFFIPALVSLREGDENDTWNFPRIPWGSAAENSNPSPAPSNTQDINLSSELQALAQKKDEYGNAVRQY
ncbi:MAG: hypothetical protein ACMXYA_03370, partial [Candidatus Woesearchaeota archaeon]